MGNKAAFSSASAPPGDTLILSVGDDAMVLCSRYRLLAAAGYSVLSATDGAQALELFGSNPVDLVLLDCVLSKIDGALVAEVMKEYKPQVPIIMVSDADASEESLAPANRYVRNGEGPDVLLAAIRELTRGDQRRFAI